GNFLFSGDDVLKQIHLLSGGEKARVSLAKLMLQEANFLILDEPTNHLDLASKEVLESALQFYPGTILFVSHDRYFINKIADRVFELTKNGIEDFLGNYDYYIERKEIEAEREKLRQKIRTIRLTIARRQLFPMLNRNDAKVKNVHAEGKLKKSRKPLSKKKRN